ncbi:MAG TPA: sigma-70 family RNA polymerase sigma factor [Flavisolibacter sp.]|nr:sigma-70 family RNA polymerase sigma factor [Flavisolibacter sp.]
MTSIRNILSGKTDTELVDDYTSTRESQYAGELYNRYADLIYGVCLKYLKNPENARDSAVAIFEELLVKIPRHTIENFKGWLYTLTKNHCLMHIRSNKKFHTVNIDAELMQSEDGAHLDGVLEKEENLVQLEYCMGELAIEQRQAIALFYIEGKCYNEISAVTGIEWNKVRSYIQNGRRNLKLCIEKQKAKSLIKE